MWGFLGWLIFASASSHAGSTELALKVPTNFEGNFLLRDERVRLASYAAAPAFVFWSTEKLRRRHPVLAWIVRGAFVAWWSYLTVHNLRQWSAHGH